MSTVESLSGILPTDVMLKILACLPARSLVRFRCVSKPWRSLLSDPFFVTMWMSRSGTTILVVPLEWGNRDQCCLVYENVYIGMKTLKLPFGNRWFSLSVVGSSSDGALICLTGLSYSRRHESKQGVILWSPYMGEIKALGNDGFVQCRRWPVCTQSLVQGDNTACCHRYAVHGFGYEPNARDYKVVRITYWYGDAAGQVYTLTRPWHVEVYSLGRDAWKSLGRPNFTATVRGNSRAFVNGSAHWLAAPCASATYNSIVAFNMEDESFGEFIGLPRSGDLAQYCLFPRGKATLSVSRGHLALIAFHECIWGECGVWVMKEYGVAESWTKQHRIVLPVGSAAVQAALGLTGRGKMLLRMADEKLVCCDAEDMEICEVGIQGGGRDSSFDVIDLEGADPTLGNQAGGSSMLTIPNLE
ncbi:hypothetical protein BT93_C0584 [Corymbia citriodora subsp. variegata]|nr:hypothetical protein BT93_C0584 [Corymbia citriodora subsp. variegata]